MGLAVCTLYMLLHQRWLCYTRTRKAARRKSMVPYYKCTNNLHPIGPKQPNHDRPLKCKLVPIIEFGHLPVRIQCFRPHRFANRQFHDATILCEPHFAYEIRPSETSRSSTHATPSCKCSVALAYAWARHSDHTLSF